MTPNSLLPTACALFIFMSGCEDALRYLKKVEAFDDDLSSYANVPGDKANLFLAKTSRDLDTDVDAVLEAMDIQSLESAAGLRLTQDEGEVLEVSDAALDVMISGQATKKAHDANNYLQIENEFLEPITAAALLQEDYSKDTINWTHAEERFYITTVKSVPVKNQGRRGTCASFAGIGQIESLLIKKYELAGIDLSEQRFYFMSKPDNWDTGGDAAKGGSNAGTGMAKSAGYEHEGKTYPPGSPEDYNIPLESDCAYVSTLGENDTQVPQPASCELGVAKVSNFRAWLYRWQDRPATAQEIYDWLLTNDTPVIVGTKLSANWEDNDGIITLKDSDGTGGTSHAAGHAYLIVGARQIDELKFPGEGGVCFIIKNSWGKGWGVNGFSCMTLAWFNAWRYKSGFPQADDVVLETSKFAEAKVVEEAPPANLNDPDENSRKYVRGPVKKRKGTINFLTQESPGEYGALLHDDNTFSKAFYKVDGKTMNIQGILADDRQLTHPLTVQIDGNQIKDEFEGKGLVTLGTLDSEKKIIEMCSGKFAQVCHLNYAESSNELVLGLTKEEHVRQDSLPPFDWTTLGVPGFNAEVSRPAGLNSLLDLRFTVGEVVTNPLRFHINPLDGLIQFQGTAIGNLTNLSFCTGDFKDVCRVVQAGENFRVLFKAPKR